MEDIIKTDPYRYIPKPDSVFNLLKGFRSQGLRYMFLKRKLDEQKPMSIKWLLYQSNICHGT